MLIAKLSDGVLELETLIGPRYVQPNFLQRVYLVWIFRNFCSLPHQVLPPWQREFVDRLWSENRFISLSTAGGAERPVIGRIERRVQPQAQVLPMRKPQLSSSSAGTERGREAASA